MLYSIDIGSLGGKMIYLYYSLAKMGDEMTFFISLYFTGRVVSSAQIAVVGDSEPVFEPGERGYVDCVIAAVYGRESFLASLVDSYWTRCTKFRSSS